MTENLRIALIQQRAAGRSCGTFWENRQENLRRGYAGRDFLCGSGYAGSAHLAAGERMG